MRNTGLLVIYLKVVILRQVSQWNGWVCPDATTNKHTISEVFHEAYLLLNFSERVEQLMASWQFSLFLRPPTARRGLNPTTDEWEKNIPWSDVSGFLLLLGTAQFDFHNMKAWIISALYSCINGGVVMICWGGAHFWPLSINWALCKWHNLLEYRWWSCPTHSVPMTRFNRAPLGCVGTEISIVWVSINQQ